MASTVQQLIYTALRALGMGLNPGQVPNTAELADGLDILNRLVDAWGTQRLTMFTTERNVQGINAGQQTYQLGLGAADWNIPRPPWLDGAGLVVSSNPTYEIPLRVLRTDKDWQYVSSVKSLSSTLPTTIYMEPDFPYATVAFWPAPASANNVALYFPVPVTQFVNLSDTVSVPPGYEEALVYDLAIHLAPAWNAQVPAAVAAIADGAKASLKRANVIASMPKMRVDRALESRKGAFDWILGVER